MKHTVTLERDGDRLRPVAVCPRKLGLIEVESCGRCPHFAGLVINPESGAPYLSCDPVGAPLLAEPGSPTAAQQPTESQTMVREIMVVPARCATLDTTLAEALVMLADSDVLPILDDLGRARGLVGKVEVLQQLYARRQEPDGEATALRDTPLTAPYVILGDASIVHVAAVMAYERLTYALVVHDDRRLAGLVSALDIVRLIACGSGYVVPER